MANSKVMLKDGTVIMDLTSDTVQADKLLSGYTAHDAAGNAVTGSFVIPTVTLQNKEAVPTKSSQNITADQGYDGLSTVTVSPIPSEYVDTTDADAASSDILDGKTAYVDGVKVTGNLGTTATVGITDNSPTREADSSVAGGYAIVLNGSVGGSGNSVITPSTNVVAKSPAIIFGNAATGDVVDGKTFTSQNGVTLSGTLGNVSSISVSADSVQRKADSGMAGGYAIVASGSYSGNKGVINSGASVETRIPALGMGNAAASDVASGKSFTSQNGVLLTGTLVVQTYYTGSTAPSSSLGQNGDLYLQI